MISTPEFWVGVSFFICIGISYKLIFPKLKAGLLSHQSEIERLFSDAETLLQASEKKFSVVQERLNALPELIVKMDSEFDSNVNNLLQEWSIQQERITTRYHSLQEHKLQHLTDHARTQSYRCVSDVCINTLQAYLYQQMSAKKHQQLVLDELKNLSNV